MSRPSLYYLLLFFELLELLRKISKCSIEFSGLADEVLLRRNLFLFILWFFEYYFFSWRISWILAFLLLLLWWLKLWACTLICFLLGVSLKLLIRELAGLFFIDCWESRRLLFLIWLILLGIGWSGVTQLHYRVCIRLESWFGRCSVVWHLNFMRRDYLEVLVLFGLNVNWFDQFERQIHITGMSFLVLISLIFNLIFIHWLRLGPLFLLLFFIA